MPIEIEMFADRRGRARAATRVFCDACDKRIEDGKKGNYLWQWQNERGARTKIYFAHKGECTHRVEASLGVQSLAWGGLSDLPIRLAANLGLDVKKRLPVPLDAQFGL